MLEVLGYRTPDPLILHFEGQVHMNDPMMTHEYSTATIRNGRWDFNPATRLGHVTRRYRDNLPGREGQEIDFYELSWPALKGASGAPLIFATDDHRRFQVLGVIVANKEHHLSPSFIETILREDNSQMEQRLYMLPLGLAVDIRQAQDMFERLTSTS